MKMGTIKVVIKTNKSREKPDERGNFFKMHRTYTVPISKFTELVDYLEQFKPKKN